MAVMTWKAFKEKMEAQGVIDGMVIDYIDFSWPHHGDGPDAYLDSVNNEVAIH